MRIASTHKRCCMSYRRNTEVAATAQQLPTDWRRRAAMIRPQLQPCQGSMTGILYLRSHSHRQVQASLR